MKEYVFLVRSGNTYMIENGLFLYQNLLLNA